MNNIPFSICFTDTYHNFCFAAYCIAAALVLCVLAGGFWFKLSVAQPVSGGQLYPGTTFFLVYKGVFPPLEAIRLSGVIQLGEHPSPGSDIGGVFIIDFITDLFSQYMISGFFPPLAIPLIGGQSAANVIWKISKTFQQHLYQPQYSFGGLTHIKFVNVYMEFRKYPLNANDDDSDEDGGGSIGSDVISRFLRSLKPAIMKNEGFGIVGSGEEYEGLIEELKKEWNEGTLFFDFVLICAQKPL
ncbi:hypothetical protein K435DRAFT_894211 [Dendrothele bispora CBS 962.96]|uniref:Uncharacterized protein n=1 Tax=Dendrothele bispora (strain CBS 962.96) TaxID=1314807 RepID=A0A4S8M1L6_DENBC|nr:hypothetical protein K435DRAFT_894211 [Dendrothele bispora CBS 962.96]